MKKLLSVFLAAIIIVSTFAIAANAAGDTISTATSISLNKNYSSSITSSSTIDFYKFTISNAGRINLKMSANLQYAYFYIYAANDLTTPVWKTGGISWNYTTELIVLNENIDLTTGTYYFCVEQGLSYVTGSYTFSLNYSSANESFKESQGGSNNKTSAANSINLNTTYYGQIAANDNKDFYKFKVSSSGDITITVSAAIQYSHYYIYDASATEVWRSGGVSWNYSTELLSLTKKISLSAGTYYFAVVQGNSETGNYNFKISGASEPVSTVKLSLSTSSVSIKKGNTSNVTCSYTGTNTNGITISYSIGDSSIVNCTWGDWNNKKIPITLKGIKEGSTTVKITLKDSSTKAVLDSKTISVTVSPSSTSTLNLSVSKNSVTIQKGESVKINCSYSGSYSGKWGMYSSNGNKEVVSCDWGSWEGKTAPITITGVKEGTASVKIYLKDESTNTVIDSETITVKVVDDTSGTGSDGGGFNIFALIISFFFYLLSFIL